MPDNSTAGRRAKCCGSDIRMRSITGSRERIDRPGQSACCSTGFCTLSGGAVHRMRRPATISRALRRRQGNPGRSAGRWDQSGLSTCVPGRMFVVVVGDRQKIEAGPQGRNLGQDLRDEEGGCRARCAGSRDRVTGPRLHQAKTKIPASAAKKRGRDGAPILDRSVG
jgi:hypothetical protein